MRTILAAAVLAAALATPALAQAPSPQQQLQQSIALKIGALELENAQLAAAVQQGRAEVASLQAENAKLKAAAPKPEPKAPAKP